MATWLYALAVSAVIAVVVGAWPDVYDNNEYKRWAMSRRSYCKDTGGVCYSTSECCKNNVCATFDESDDNNPTNPGTCVHEKELDPCMSNLDCSRGQCMPLGGQMYCVPAEPIARKLISDLFQERGRLGSKCKDTSDCNETTVDEKYKLCCQRLTGRRTGSGNQCQKVRSMSKCISK